MGSVGVLRFVWLWLPGVLVCVLSSFGLFPWLCGALYVSFGVGFGCLFGMVAFVTVCFGCLVLLCLGWVWAFGWFDCDWIVFLMLLFCLGTYC